MPTKKRGRELVLPLLAALVVVFWANVQGESAQKPVVLKFATTHGYPGQQAAPDVAYSWQKEVTRRTNGAITFENHWSSSLGAPAEHIDLVKTGVVDVCQTYPWYTPTRMPLFIFEHTLPFGVVDYELLLKAKKQIRSEFPQFGEELAKQNVIMMTDTGATAYTMLSRIPLRKLDDFKGKKVGLIGRYFGRWLPPGAVPVVRPGQERYELLKNGVVDVDINATDTQYGWKLYEVTSYFMSNLKLTTVLALPVLMNKDSFNKLSPETQKILVDAGKDVEIRWAKEIGPGWDDRAVAEFKKAGIKLIDFPKADVEKWAATLEDIPAEWAKETDALGLPGSKIIQRWQEITSELGFKWARKWGVKK